MGFLKRMFVDTWREAGVEAGIEVYVAHFKWFNRSSDRVQRTIKLTADRLVHSCGGVDAYRTLPSKLRDRMEELLAYILVHKLSPNHQGPPVMTAVLITHLRLVEEAAALGLDNVPELDHWLAQVEC